MLQPLNSVEFGGGCAIAWRLRMNHNGELLAIKKPFVLAALALVGQLSTCYGSQAQTLGLDKVKGFFSADTQRVVLDSSAFDGPDLAIPFWSNGSFVVRQIESYDGNVPNVRIYDGSGKKIREATVWFAGSQRIILSSVATGASGTLFVTGMANKPDGTRAFFLASTDVQGKVSSAIQMGEYHPRHVCAAPDGTLWTFGEMEWDMVAGHAKEGNTLRNFDLQKGELSSYLPRSEFANSNFDAGGTWIRCTDTAVQIYAASGSYIVLKYGEKQPQQYRAPLSSGLFIAGLAILDSGKIFAYQGTTRSSAKPQTGLYQLLLDDGLKVGHWKLVATDSNSPVASERVYRLWGADGENLVVGLQDDPMNY